MKKHIYDPNGDLYCTLPHIDGRIDGTRLEYYDNKLCKSTEYVDGKREGVHKEFGWQGKLELKTTYVNDLESGTRLEYNSYGAVHMETPYIDGLAHGVGRLRFVCETFNNRYFLKGKCVSEKIYDEYVFITKIAKEHALLAVKEIAGTGAELK